MKKNWAIRKDAEAVSPVIATILMVAITVVLAAVLYVMVLGFGSGGTSTPGRATDNHSPRRSRRGVWQREQSRPSAASGAWHRGQSIGVCMV